MRKIDFLDLEIRQLRRKRRNMGFQEPRDDPSKQPENSTNEEERQDDTFKSPRRNKISEQEDYYSNAEDLEIRQLRRKRPRMGFQEPRDDPSKPPERSTNEEERQDDTFKSPRRNKISEQEDSYSNAEEPAQRDDRGKSSRRSTISNREDSSREFESPRDNRSTLCKSPKLLQEESSHGKFEDPFEGSTYGYPESKLPRYKPTGYEWLSGSKDEDDASEEGTVFKEDLSSGSSTEEEDFDNINMWLSCIEEEDDDASEEGPVFKEDLSDGSSTEEDDCDDSDFVLEED